MKKKNLEKKVSLCAGALISGLDQPKEEIGLVGTYLHPCMKRIGYFDLKEKEVKKWKRKYG